MLNRCHPPTALIGAGEVCDQRRNGGKSIGQKETKELAVMIDSFRPLQLTMQARQIEQPDYYKSWL